MQQQQDFHPVTACNDGLFNSYTGRLINLLTPTEHMIDIQDIAHALSNICRFGGQCSRFYSVAQHSVLVAALAGKECPQEALMHDAAEAYLGDVIKPLKVILGAAYTNLEVNFETLISAKFGLNITKATKAIIKRYDLKALELEHEALIKGNPTPLIEAMTLYELHEPGLEDDYAWTAPLAKMVFLTNYAQNL